MLLAPPVKRIITIGAASFALFAVTAFGQQDPPSRVARLNYINGNVSMEPAGIDDWAPAAVNRPFTTGDYLYADQKSVAELHMDIAAMRLGELTSFGILNLNDQVTQLKLTEGDMYFRIHDFGDNQTFEVDTPNAAITLLRDGVYRIHVDPNANTTYVVTRSGQAEITGGSQAFTLNPGDAASLSGTDQLAYNIEPAPAPDVFDSWCDQRDAYEARNASSRYIPPTVIGGEDLGDNGVWSETPDYGAVWYPRSVDPGWAPYHNGHWAWIEPWGWTWVDDAPWGFAPFHYGRWVYWHERWGWAPGPIAVVVGRPYFRPVYSPALVAWFGGSHWGVSVGIGGAPSLGWVALGFGEVYTPHYACSRQYFSNINLHNTRIERNVNITNVYNNVYVNHTVYNQRFANVRSPNAVVSMPQRAFASGRSVRQDGVSLGPNQIAHFTPAQSTVTAPSVVPTRQALAPSIGERAVRPSAQIMQRQVLARTTPPPAPISFAARQSYIQQHAGQPHNFEAMHQAVAPATRPVAMVRQISPRQPIAVRPGNSVGNAPAPAAFARPAGRAVQPNRPQESIHTMEPNRPMQPARPEQQQPLNERGPERQSHQVAPSSVHGTPPNLHREYNGPANNPQAPNPAYSNRPVERVQPERVQPERAQPERAQPQPIRPQQYNRPEANPPRPPRNETAPPPRQAEPASNRPVEQPRREERSVSEAHPQSHAEAHSEPHNESHHDEKK
jgi:hypothetical protein